MTEDSMLMCLICFVIGYLISRMMRGDGLMVGARDGENPLCKFKPWSESCGQCPSPICTKY